MLALTFLFLLILGVAILALILCLQGVIIKQQGTLIERIDEIMPTVHEELAALKAALDGFITQVVDLITQLRSGSITPEELDAALQPEIDRLKAALTPPPPPGV